MSLPEFGGIEHNTTRAQRAGPWEYDLVLSDSEGGIGRLLELGARRAEEALYSALSPEFFEAHAVEKEVDVFFYGSSNEFRRRMR